MGIIFRLSTRKRKKKDGLDVCEVLARLHSNVTDQYAKTGVWVPESFTDKSGNRKVTWADGHVVIPRISYADDAKVSIKKMLTDARERLEQIERTVNEAYGELLARQMKPEKGWLQVAIESIAQNDLTSSSCHPKILVE